MKTIIQRNLDLKKKYFFVNKTYIPLLEGSGATCANCNKLIANIATVKDAGGNYFNIGLDCLETLMLNNKFLEGFNFDFEKAKKQLPKIKRGLKFVSEYIQDLPQTNIVDIEYSSIFGDWFEAYYKKGDKVIYNSAHKIKDIEIDFFIQTLKDNYKNIEINLISK